MGLIRRDKIQLLKEKIMLDFCGAEMYFSHISFIKFPLI